MAEEGAQDRTEAPTPKRRSEARSKGNVARSQEINSVAVLITAIVLLKIFASYIYQELSEVFNQCFHLMSTPDEVGMKTVLSLGMFVFKQIGFIVFPIALGVMVVGILVNIFQVGWLFTWQPLQPKFSKINPFSGLKKLVGPRSLVELVKNLFKIAIVGFVAYVTIKAKFNETLMLSEASAGGILLFLLTNAFTIIWRIALIMIIIALLDYAYQKWDYEKNLKMTKEEIKEERKSMEGDPKVKQRMRSLHLEMARRRMMENVPKATVVVTNPTYIAIAIQYEAEQMDAPIVLAKGKRVIAEKIRSIAKENNIPIYEDKPLARAMYDKVDIGESVPVEFYNAVAQILAYVYNLKKKKAA